MCICLVSKEQHTTTVCTSFYSRMQCVDDLGQHITVCIVLIQSYGLMAHDLSHPVEILCKVLYRIGSRLHFVLLFFLSLSLSLSLCLYCLSHATWLALKPVNRFARSQRQTHLFLFTDHKCYARSTSSLKSQTRFFAQLDSPPADVCTVHNSVLRHA